MRSRISRRSLGAIPIVLVAMSVGAAAAFGAAPIKGATYKGKMSVAAKPWHRAYKAPIRFKVSANGKRVGQFAFNYPVYCQGGGFGSFHSKSGTITKDGTFKVKMPIVFHGTRQGSVIVSGKFAKHGRESGKVTTDFTVPFFHSCSGTSSYATKG